MIIQAKCLIFGQTRSDSNEEYQSSLTGRNIKTSVGKTNTNTCKNLAKQ